MAPSIILKLELQIIQIICLNQGNWENVRRKADCGQFVCSLGCRQSLCGTSCQPTTSTQTLLRDGEWAWKTSCCALHHIPSSPMTKSSSSFLQRLVLKLVPDIEVLCHYVCWRACPQTLTVWQISSWQHFDSTMAKQCMRLCRWVDTKCKNSSQRAYHAAVEKIEAEPVFCRGPLQWHLCHDQHSDHIDMHDRAFK